MSDDVVRGDVPEVDDGPEYDLDFRECPERYRYTPDERGAFKVEPYKGDLLPLWTISDVAGAREAAADIYGRFEDYRDQGDFVGMDMARKYLQMGWTRALRYAKYPGGQKYERDADGNRVKREPQEWYDEEKREIAALYRDFLDRVREDETYRECRKRHREQYAE